MARGQNAKRGGRGAGRGKGAGFAQSAGISHTFGGGKGGTAASKAAGGSKGTKPIRRGTLANGTQVTVRSPGGDNTQVAGALSGARVGPNVAAQHGTRRDNKILPHLRKGASRGRGGSNQ